jgi:hypothetical protein
VRKLQDKRGANMARSGGQTGPSRKEAAARLRAVVRNHKRNSAMLLSLGLITKEQAKSLEMESQYVMGISLSDSHAILMEQWLGKYLVPCDRPIGSEQFDCGYEEEEFEVEQFKELEAKAVAQDDDGIEVLRGPVALLNDNYEGTGAYLSDADFQDILRNATTGYAFFHEWPESRDANMSALNTKEAETIVQFFDYLALNGIDATKITILTSYNDQRKEILRKLRAHPNLRVYSGIQVVTVDSYQGKENDIVLLPLVCSNRNHAIGFLSSENNAFISLSRAKCGFYIFGNAELLA